MLLLKRYAALVYLAIAIIIFLTVSFFLIFRFDTVEKLVDIVNENSVRIPILMYHHFADDKNNPSVVISAERFESHVKALVDAGYTAISFEELCAFVYDNAKLPERPIIITSDDGYTSVYETAFPILKKYGTKATVFVIGALHGQTLYKDTTYPVFPLHFGDEEGRIMAQSGILSIQSHSYDMHQVEAYETPPFRIGIMPMEGESEDEYIAAFKADFERSAAQIENMTGARPFVFSYPYGRSTDLSEKLLRECGVKVTLTIKKGPNYVKRNNPDSLYRLKRYNVSGNMSAAELLAMIR